MSSSPGSGPPEDGDSAGMDSLLAQLRQHSKPVNLSSSFHYYNEPSSFYGHPQSQQLSQSLFLPAAPKLPDGPSVNRNSAGQTPEVSLPKPVSGTTSTVDRTSSLLNLLKFSQQSAISAANSTSLSTAQPLPISREASASHTGSEGQTQVLSQSRHESDLLASLMSSASAKSIQQISPQYPKSSIGSANLTQAITSPSTDTQAYLLQLLNKPKPETNSSPPLKEIKKPPTPQTKNTNESTAETVRHENGEVFIEKSEKGDKNEKIDDSEKIPGAPNAPQVIGKESTRSIIREPEKANKSSGIFTYVNPFDELAASSPRNRGPKSEHQRSIKPTVQILKNPRDDSSEKASTDPSSDSSPHDQKLTISNDNIGSNPSLLNGLGQVGELAHTNMTKRKLSSGENPSVDIDKQTPQPLSKSEKGKGNSQIENELRDMLAAKSEKESVSSSKSTSKSKTTQRSTAHAQVAENWENADVDNSAREEENIMTVYNFPLHPFTSITMKSKEYERPFFREEAFSEIARLKKDFDQVDRTLVTASMNYITYCMSKNGGIRVIRQYDGRDIKVFTETQDRVFNVITSTSSYQKEAIIGTGISGKIYWMMIKDNDGDHLEDSHLETFGFVLPPLPEPDSEMLGGILRSRARKSSNHPEFFAVARGKCIFIILPELILQQNFVKDGEKRLVDLDRYLNHRSLKISNGKSGKDLTFSDDDTTIASLDKAGQIKFWDIRSLTGPDVFSSSPEPLAKEILQPLLTLSTTSTGEKSTASSIIFVDKLRPFVRGGPLRYFILGMKQNHTLQLWDIALRKPVQVIHLPHSNESDPICSIAFHAGTGMIIVGHPTRNSVYFIHFSAPKYTLSKSIFQAEFVNAVAKNPSLTPPDATAVISGIQEYSFENKGSLRSIDILQNQNASTSPNFSNSPDFLFELYCMHSKGVTCIHVHQKDLGLDSENKVVHPASAEDLGIIGLAPLGENSATKTSEDPRNTLPSLAPSRMIPISALIDSHKQKDYSRSVNHSESSNSAVAKLDVRTDKKITQPAANGLSSYAANERSDKKDQSSSIHVLSGSGEKSEKKEHLSPSRRYSGSNERTDKKVHSSLVPGFLGSGERSDKKVHSSHNLGLSSSGERSETKDNSPQTRILPGPSERFDKKDHLSQVHGLSAQSVSEKADKKKRRKGINDVRGPSPIHTSYKMPVMDPTSNVRNLNLNRAYNNAVPESTNHSLASTTNNEVNLKSIEKCFSTSFKNFSQDFKTNFQVPESVTSANQDAMLRMISTTLIEKMDVTLTKIVKSSIETDVIPVIADATARAVQDHFNSNFNRLASHLSGEIERSILGGISHTLTEPRLASQISENLAAPVAMNIVKEINVLIANNIMPAVSDLFAQNTLKITTEIQRRTAEHINVIEQRHISDSSKIAQLSKLVSGISDNLASVSETVSSMSAAQTEFQGKFLEMQQQSVRDRNQHQSTDNITNNHISRPPSSLAEPVNKSREEEYENMLNSIISAINAGEYENAVIQWLQTQREQEFFMNFFAKFSPDFVRELSPLLLLSLGATISVEFEGEVNNDFLHQRISWLEMILTTFQAHISDGSIEDEVRSLCPKIMDIYRQRFEHLYMRIGQLSPHEPILKRLSFLVTAANRIIETAQVNGRHHDYSGGLGIGNGGARHGL